MSTIIGTLPLVLANGTPQDANQVMTLFNWIQSQVNANAALSGVGTSFSGVGDPSTVPGNGIQAYSLWGDTSVSPNTLRRRNAANSAWVPVGKLLLDNGNAANIDVAPVGNITATNVQSALAQVDTEAAAAATNASTKVDKAGDTMTGNLVCGAGTFQASNGDIVSSSYNSGSAIAGINNAVNIGNNAQSSANNAQNSANAAYNLAASKIGAGDVAGVIAGYGAVSVGSYCVLRGINSPSGGGGMGFQLSGAYLGYSDFAGNGSSSSIGGAYRAVSNWSVGNGSPGLWLRYA